MCFGSCAVRRLYAKIRDPACIDCLSGLCECSVIPIMRDGTLLLQLRVRPVPHLRRSGRRCSLVPTPSHACTAAGLAPATSAPRLGSRLRCRRAPGCRHVVRVRSMGAREYCEVSA